MLSTKQKIRIARTTARVVTGVRRSFGAGDGAQDAPPAALAASWPLGARPGGHPMHGGHGMTTAGASMDTLDAYVARADIARIDFIKLDVDGNECQALRGGRKTLQRFRPPIILELAPYIFSRGENSFATFIELLRDAGYQLMRAPAGAPLPSDAAALSRAIPDGFSINAWAMPA